MRLSTLHSARPVDGRNEPCSILAASGSRSTTAADEAVSCTELYQELGVDPRASKADIKKAYRQRARQYHPDVNPSEDAAERFIKLSNAYEVLVDEEQRGRYDKFGLAGLGSGWEQKSAGKAAWDAFDTWDEFKPFKRKTRRRDARDAAAGQSQQTDDEALSEENGGAGGVGGGSREAQLGDVVEYPLSEATKSRLRDGRERGVGLVVGRNKDRGDWQRLPPENLSLVEIEPLCFEEEEGGCWRADDLESSAFARLEDLRTLRSVFDQRFDTWRILDELSDGCGSPVYEEEVIL